MNTFVFSLFLSNACKALLSLSVLLSLSFSHALSISWITARAERLLSNWLWLALPLCHSFDMPLFYFVL